MLDASVASLSGLNLDQLRLQWRNHLGGIAPAHLPGWLLMRVLAYRIQAAAFGDLDRTILRRLRDDALESGGARPFAPRGPTTREGVELKSGALLVREWSGRLERVMVLDDGYAWNGCVYRSLSQVAKAITGTNWNGHRFFGLKAVRNGAPNRKRSRWRRRCARRPLSRDVRPSDADPWRALHRRDPSTVERSRRAKARSCRRPARTSSPAASRSRGSSAPRPSARRHRGPAAAKRDRSGSWKGHRRTSESWSEPAGCP